MLRPPFEKWTAPDEHFDCFQPHHPFVPVTIHSLMGNNLGKIAEILRRVYGG
jgi:hypothetical protein